MSTKTENTPIHIVGLRAENVQRLELVELDLVAEGGVVEIHGKNGAGKSTLLNCLQMAFAGARAVGDVPIRTGADDAEITVSTSNGLTITRRFTSSGNTYLDVRNAEGFKAAKAQSMLDRLLGPGRSLDPHAFMLSDAKKQAERLRQIAGVDTRVIDSKIDEAFETRADANKDVQREEGRLAELIEPPEGAELEDQDTAAIETKIDSATAHNAQRATLEANVTGAETAVETRRSLRDAAAKAFDELEARHVAATEELVARHQREAEELAARHRAEQEEATDRRGETAQKVDEAEAARTEAVKVLEAFEPIEVGTLRAELEALRAANKQRELWRAYEAQADRVGEARREARQRTEYLENLRNQRRKMIAEATMPVPGLGFTSDGKVSFNDLPFDQAAHSEQLRVSLAIAMAAAPDLRVINFTDASLLDEASMAIVRELAADRGYQVLAEFVDSEPGDVGIYIDAGRVTHRDGEPVVQPDHHKVTEEEVKAAQAASPDGVAVVTKPFLPGDESVAPLDVGSGPAGDLDPDEPLAG